MTFIIVEMLIVGALLVANGVFAMSEMAVVSSRKSKLKQMAAAGDRGAEAALRLAEKPERFLPTVQIGITLIGLLAGAFSSFPLLIAQSFPLLIAPRQSIYANLAAGTPVRVADPVFVRQDETVLQVLNHRYGSHLR